MSLESECKQKMEKLLQNQAKKLFWEAADIYMAAAVLTKESFFNGGGDRSAYLEYILTIT